MSSRDKILAAVKANQPGILPLPALNFSDGNEDLLAKFTATLTTIGGVVIEINNHKEIKEHINPNTLAEKRIVTTISALRDIAELLVDFPDDLENTELAIIKAHFGVAENGAVWLTEDAMGGQRVLPFITQHLAVVLSAGDIVATMHRAYEKIGNEKYGFGTFIAGPSKTADIEQSLVVGAHGPRSMTVFVVK